MKSIQKKGQKIIREFAIANYEKINVKPGICRYNFRCQMNAVNDAWSNDHKKIAMCICIEDDFPFIHFVNVTNDGQFKDNTLGQWSRNQEYYLVKFIHEEDFQNINKIFNYYIAELKNRLPFIIRHLYKGGF